MCVGISGYWAPRTCSAHTSLHDLPDAFAGTALRSASCFSSAASSTLMLKSEGRNGWTLAGLNPAYADWGQGIPRLPRWLFKRRGERHTDLLRVD